MSVIIAIVGLTLGTYLYEPLWFDKRMHHYKSTHQSKKACNIVAINSLNQKTGRVCIPKNNHSGHVDLYTTENRS